MRTKESAKNGVPKKKDERSGRLRMRDLTEATGLPKSAILHYVAQGLLPVPEKTSRNMAYYDPASVERVKFVKSMQEKYSFPLSKIRSLLKARDAGKNMEPLIELSGVVFGSGDGPHMNEQTFSAATGLAPKDMAQLKKMGLLLPLERGQYGQSDIAVGKIYAQGFAAGIKVTDLSFYAEAAKRIVDEEMRLRRRLTSGLPEDHDAAVTTGMVRAARAIRNYVIDRTFQQRIAAAKKLQDEVLTS
jgi:DNA-binding transcriptional MerR regulator